MSVPEGIQGESFDLSPAKDYSLRYLTNLLFDRVEFFVLNYSWYSNWDTWSVMKNYRSQGQSLLQVFEYLQDSVMSLLGVKLLRAATLTVIELDGDGSPQPEEQQSGT